VIRTLRGTAAYQAIGTSVSTGLSATAILYTALATDPEPFTKAALAVAAGVVALLETMGVGAGCGNTCVRATAVVNQLEPYLKTNLANYMAQAIPRSASSQTTALKLFDAVWADVVTGCSDPSLGNAGKACISDRQPGGKWDWFAYYRTPIAKDANVAAAPVLQTAAQAVLSAIAPGATISAETASYLPLLIGAAILVWVIS
jgi:hypothetical protein